MKKLLGYVGVDSGQVIITDPCYLKGFVNDDMKDIRVYKLISTGKDFQFGKDFLTYEEMIYKGKTMNQLIADKEVIDLSDKYHKVFDYSYNGACNRTIYDKRGGGEIGLGEQGVVSRTGWGDGNYPVYAHYDKETGRISKLEIEFM